MTSNTSEARTSYAEVDAKLTAAGEFFELEDVEVRGVNVRAWKSAPRNIRDIIVQQGRGPAAERPYIILNDEVLTQEAHRKAAIALAHNLINELGVKKGDRVAIAMRNYPDWAIAYFGAILAGAIVTPLNGWWSAVELAFGITDSGATVLIGDGERLERLGATCSDVGLTHVVGVRLDDRPGRAELPSDILNLYDLTLSEDDLEAPEVPLDPDDPVTILYTSGTTGHPKGVVGTHRNICNNLVTMMYGGARNMLRFGTQPPSGEQSLPRLLVSGPLFHATGCHAHLISGAFFGSTLVFMRKWDVEKALELIEKHRLTQVGGVTAMMADMINSPSFEKFDLSSVVGVGGGGTATPPELVRRIAAAFPGRSQGTGYGLTEATSIVTLISGDDYVDRPSSSGVPVAIARVRIVDDDDKEVPTGVTGEVVVNSPTVAKEYWNRPDETARTFRDGWLHTGDIGRFDDEGFIYIVDRIKDIIIRGSENISSAEVEAALFVHPAVAEAAAIGLPHPSLGEEVGAVISLRPGVSADDVDLEEVRKFVGSQIASFKVPNRIWIALDPLPHNATGKLSEARVAYRRYRFGGVGRDGQNIAPHYIVLRIQLEPIGGKR